MSSWPRVASVLLVAHPRRAPDLAPWMRVVGEPVSYAVEALAPTAAIEAAFASWWDVIVVDGESFTCDQGRESVLRALRLHRDRLSTLLFICTRLPSDVEVQQAFAWADDQISQGWEFGIRLQRRVQSIALAPWRRSVALRVEAELRGDRRLRVVRSAGESP